jgi:hypothetical protein
LQKEKERRNEMHSQITENYYLSIIAAFLYNFWSHPVRSSYKLTKQEKRIEGSFVNLKYPK